MVAILLRSPGSETQSIDFAHSRKMWQFYWTLCAMAGFQSLADTHTIQGAFAPETISRANK